MSIEQFQILAKLGKYSYFIMKFKDNVSLLSTKFRLLLCEHVWQRPIVLNKVSITLLSWRILFFKFSFTPSYLQRRHRNDQTTNLTDSSDGLLLKYNITFTNVTLHC